jgi:pterin-4a-carbinolamine dehydratase
MQQFFSTPVGTLTANPLQPTVWLRRPPHREQELKPERVQEVLQAMPAWKFNEDRRTIDCLNDFGDARVALAYAAFVSEIAAADRQVISVLVSGSLVGVTLHGYPRRGNTGGITESVLELAKRLG